MTHPSKQKGNRFEREVVALAQEYGLFAKRAYASNGESLGKSETIDVIVGELDGGCKRRASLAKYLKPPKDADVNFIREDRGEIYAVMSARKLFELMTKPEERNAGT